MNPPAQVNYHALNPRYTGSPFYYKSSVPLDYMLYLYDGPLSFCNKVRTVYLSVRMLGASTWMLGASVRMLGYPHGCFAMPTDCTPPDLLPDPLLTPSPPPLSPGVLRQQAVRDAVLGGGHLQPP